MYRITAFLFFLCICKHAHSSATSKPLRVVVASNFVSPLKSLIHHKPLSFPIQLLTSSSGKAFQQIRMAAPYDVFLSANQAYPQKLYQLGLTEKPFLYAKGRLVAWFPGSHRFNEQTIKQHLHRRGKVALANPKVAPYGRAATELLKYLDPSSHARNKVIGENVSQAFNYTHASQDLVGFVALSQVINKKVKAQSYWVIPKAYHKPIEQYGAIIKDSQNKELALEFIHYLLSHDSQIYIKSQGYDFAESY